MLFLFIGLISSKVLLKQMMLNYYKMTKAFSFCLNKIVLIPQRILILLIYKYYDCDLTAIEPREVMDILQLN